MSSEEAAKKNSVVVKVGMVGDSQIGKTSLMVKYVEGSFDEDYIQTLGVNFMEKTISIRNHEITFSIWDLGGQREFVNMLPLVCNDAVAILFMFDLSRKSTLNSIKEWYRQARGFNKTAIPFLIGTKYDQFANFPKEEQEEITKQARRFARAMKASLIFCSTSHSINVQKIFKIVLSKAFDLKCTIPEIKEVDFDEYGIWPKIADDFRTHLPLRNLHWKSAKGSTRNIMVLGVELKRFTPETTEKPHMMPETLLEKPYLNLYFVNCEDNEAYRQTIRQKIRDWVNIVTAPSKKNQEWLIVYVTKQETLRNAAKYFSMNMKGTVFDKIKADFNTSRRDRCVQLRLSDNDADEYESWQELMSKIKDGILISFDQHVVQYEEDIRRFDSQRSMIGWNYCTFFVLKEGLALTFEVFNLYEEALVQYDELEASFFQVLRDRALAWFGDFGAIDVKDDSANILDVKKKPYRDLIRQNKLPEFDFRCYLFARQCHLLGRLQRPVEICRRAQLFISTFGRTIKDHQANVGEHFLESWIYSSCMSVVSECEELAPLTSLDESTSSAFNAAKGELLDLARKQLDKLGIHYNHLPASLPFTTALGEVSLPASPSTPSSEKKFSITNEELKGAIESEDSAAFDLLYLQLTNRGLKAYEGTRLRSSYRLQGDVAALQFHRKNFESASQLMEDLPTAYGEQGWTVVENSLLLKYAECQKELGRTKQYPLIFIRCNHTLLSEKEAGFYMEEVKGLCGSLERDEDIIRPFKPMFLVTVTDIIDDITDEDGPYMAVELTNYLPTSLTFDQLAIRLNSASGNYVVENVRMSVGKIVFTHNFLNESKKKFFRINEHPAVLRAQIIAPEEKQQYFVVQIFTGLTSVTKGSLILEPLSEGLTFPATDKYHVVSKSVNDGIISKDILSEDDFEVSEEGHIQIPFLKTNQLSQFKVPYDCNWGAIEHKVKITVEYESKGKSRVFTSLDTVKVWLPLAVTELNIFRDDCLFVKMDITLNGNVPVRILETSLVPSKVYDVVDNPAVSTPDISLFAKQHASFVYKLTRSKDYDHGEHAKSPSTKVHFVVTYRTLQNEVEKYIEHILNKILKAKNLLQHSRFLLENAKEHLLKSVDYVSYGMTDTLDLGELDVSQCVALFTSHGSFKESLIEVVKEFWEVLNTVELVISKPNDLVVGEPCHCRLIIRHSSYWNYTSEHKDTFEFFYDVHVDFDNWLLAGHKKLCFTSKIGETKEFPITLVPLKTGSLLVPPIRIASPSPNIFSETVYLNNAEQVLVRPRTQSATFFIEQQHRIHSLHSAAGFGAPEHHNDSGLDEINMD
ncbi:24821_t:CDS:10 [Dentiscutata erythropus]|uniref:24821_t:CDS:1 n=1 Tax=Dentiscutata erythropus TaxID=1348616 RepID=A0A9N9HDP6_9GLOM|nr:24821_t:CDS:10 [Dentiscutata erythropus]